MAAGRAVDYGDGTVQHEPAQPTPADKIEGLPTTGWFGKSPAKAIGIIMFLTQLAVRYAVQRGYISLPSPEFMKIADEWGDDAALVLISAISSLPALIQGWWTAMRVFSPRSVWKRYFKPAEDAKRVPKA